MKLLKISYIDELFNDYDYVKYPENTFFKVGWEIIVKNDDLLKIASIVSIEDKDDVDVTTSFVRVATKRDREQHNKNKKDSIEALTLAQEKSLELDLDMHFISSFYTFDIVNSKGEFIGGVIAPGINTQLTSLSKCTSKLPKLDAAKSENAIGDNTLDAILSGVIRGTACMVDGLIEQCENELGENATIVATGGLCRLIAKYMNREFDDINPTLTLLGLKELYKLNQNQEHLLHQYL